jgi:hypothetical protein
MARLGRKGRIVKWMGLVLSLVVVAAWLVSQPWGWVYWRQTYTSHPLFLAVEMRRGILWVNYCRVIAVTSGNDFSIPQPDLVLFRVFRDTNSAGVPFDLWRIPASQLAPRVGSAEFSRGWYFSLPLWMPFLLVAVPTGCLWWRDRRRRIPPGHCQRCGYNLTGNVSGVCPECGERV